MNTQSNPAALGQGEELLTIKQVAARLQVSTKTVARLISNLDVPVARVGNQVRIPARHFALFLTKSW